ncbi:hypothetical protein N7539_006939 [Penicillium diatomitis]|uniref:Uncharacterized protein n=1 Tax=Penicillium diatomitis TaxID=2819901 RepID=A0A9W9X2H9_9EURO|nr:uncharacterized protein N7539_006939 [Penicillium diatomitis]KAJ5481045.1 hypothetical protein N7539_006939 [Penicillium diatomitis]
MATSNFHDFSTLTNASDPGLSSLTFALQALLHRHESYIAEAERDRQRLESSLTELEAEKRKVQEENARIVEENRSLLDHLESLNRTALESDDHVRSLTQALENTQTELRRVTAAAARAADLEAQLVLMETQQSHLQDQVMTACESEKSAIQRWKSAQLMLRDLHEQVERIESEAREEREQHEELIQRLERKRAVERELDRAAGRLKGAAAASELGRNPNTHVVSRFVKDILQDNANLQVGIMELREMLESSNQEVQNLREQIHMHQPLAGLGETEHGGPLRCTTLSEELRSKERPASKEFHIHHHYHTSTSALKKEKGTLTRRAKKRRPTLGSPAPLYSSVNGQSPRRPSHRSQSSSSSINTILSQTSVSIPPTSSRRWSHCSPATDSMASSPRSAFRTSSIFDRIDREFESSQPTSPESTAFSSPVLQAHNGKGLDLPIRSLPPLDDINREGASPDSYGEWPSAQSDHAGLYANMTHQPIPEESETPPRSSHGSTTLDPGLSPEKVFALQFPPLRRSSSHESLLSVAGMDIHTPNDRHARMRMGEWYPGPRIPRRLVYPSTELASTPPVVSAPIVIADRASGPIQSPRSLLASVAAGSGLALESGSINSADSNSNSNSTTSMATLGPRKTTTLTRRMGGWVLGKWGTAPVPSDALEDNKSATHAAAEATDHLSASSLPAAQPRFRFTGVNQKGPILGLRPPPQAPTNVQPKDIDQDLLRESLAEGGL